MIRNACICPFAIYNNNHPIPPIVFSLGIFFFGLALFWDPFLYVSFLKIVDFKLYFAPLPKPQHFLLVSINFFPFFLEKKLLICANF